MGLFGFLRGRPPVADRKALEDFLDRQAAFMSQKAVFEYSRARSGLLSSKLFKEQAFKAAVEEARWRNYPLCLQNAVLMVEVALRPHAEDATAMRQGLSAVVGNICGRYAIPAGFEADFWGSAHEEIGRRIDRAGLAAPRAVKDIPNEMADRFIANLPIHANLRGDDRILLTNNLRVHLCRAYDDFIAAADSPRLADALMKKARE